MLRNLSYLIVAVFFILSLPCRAQQWVQYKSSNSALPSSNVTSLSKNTTGKVYASTTSGLAFFNNGIWQLMYVGSVYSPSILRA